MTPIVVPGPLLCSAGDVAAAAGDHQDHVEPRAGLEVADLQIRVEDLEVRGGRDVAGGDRAGPDLGELDLDLADLAVEAGDQLAQVEDDVGDVLAQARGSW